MEAIEHASVAQGQRRNENISDNGIVDALPYIDLGYDEPGVREAALALVEEETRRYRPTKNYLQQVLPPNFVTLNLTGQNYMELKNQPTNQPTNTTLRAEQE